jgi:hypothetical protein
MNEYYLAVLILVAAYIFVSPLFLIMIFGDKYSSSFKEDYLAAFVGFHAIATSAVAIIGVFLGVTWAIDVVF